MDVNMHREKAKSHTTEGRTEKVERESVDIVVSRRVFKSESSHSTQGQTCTSPHPCQGASDFVVQRILKRTTEEVQKMDERIAGETRMSQETEGVTKRQVGQLGKRTGK